MPDGRRRLRRRERIVVLVTPAEQRNTPPGGRLARADERRDADLLVVDDLAKAFGGVRAVDGVSFRVPAGAMAGLIGPNGAGKSTVLGMIAGAIRPDRGEILLAGSNIAGSTAGRDRPAGRDPHVSDRERVRQNDGAREPPARRAAVAR